MGRVIVQALGPNHHKNKLQTVIDNWPRTHRSIALGRQVDLDGLSLLSNNIMDLGQGSSTKGTRSTSQGWITTMDHWMTTPNMQVIEPHPELPRQ